MAGSGFGPRFPEDGRLANPPPAQLEMIKDESATKMVALI